MNSILKSAFRWNVA